MIPWSTISWKDGNPVGNVTLQDQQQALPSSKADPDHFLLFKLMIPLLFRIVWEYPCITLKLNYSLVLWLYIYMYVCVYLCIHTLYMCVCVYMCVCICIYIYSSRRQKSIMYPDKQGHLWEARRLSYSYRAVSLKQVAHRQVSSSYVLML